MRAVEKVVPLRPFRKVFLLPYVDESLTGPEHHVVRLRPYWADRATAWENFAVQVDSEVLPNNTRVGATGAKCRDDRVTDGSDSSREKEGFHNVGAMKFDATGLEWKCRNERYKKVARRFDNVKGPTYCWTLCIRVVPLVRLRRPDPLAQGMPGVRDSTSAMS